MIAGLYPLIDDALVPPERFPGIARALAHAGCRIIQLRMKRADDRTRLETQRAVGAALAGTVGLTLCVNDRADLARVLAAEAPREIEVALHLGQGDLPPRAARAIVGPHVRLGLSTHTLAQLDAARAEPVDYLALGPIFPTRSKAGTAAALGLDALRVAARRSRRPLVAVGGLTLETIPAARAAGAAAVAVIGALFAELDLASPAAISEVSHRARALAFSANEAR